MAYRRARVFLLPVVILGIIVAGVILSRSHPHDVAKESQVKNTFDSCKMALLNGQSGPTRACFSRNLDDYLNRLKFGTPNASEDPSPVVDHFLRTALVRKVPSDMRSHLTLDLLLQRIMEKKLIDPRDIQPLDLGRIDVNGDRATAELYYQGTFTTLSLPFVQEGKDWKIDILSLLPYAELMMRLDRTVNGKTEDQQVELLVSGLPSL